MNPALLLAACLAAQAEYAALPPFGLTVSCGVVRIGPRPGEPLEVVAGPDDVHYLWVEPDTAIVWHLDRSVALPAGSLRPGTRVRCELRPRTNLVAVAEVVSLGPLAMEAAVEEFAAAAGPFPGKGMPPGDRAVLEALGAPCFAIRDAASRRLRRRPEALRAVVWAGRSADPEVRARAAALLRELGGGP